MIPYKTNSQYAEEILSGKTESIDYLRDINVQVFDCNEYRYIPFLCALAKNAYLWRTCIERIITRTNITNFIDAVNYHPQTGATNMECLLKHYNLDKAFNKEALIERIVTNGLKNAISTSSSTYVRYLIKTFDIKQYVKHDIIFTYLWEIVSRNCSSSLDNSISDSSIFKNLFVEFNVSLYNLPPKDAYCYNHNSRYSILDLAILNGYPVVAALILDEVEKYDINLTHTGDYLRVSLLSALRDPSNIFWVADSLTKRLCKRAGITEVPMMDGSTRKVES